MENFHYIWCVKICRKYVHKIQVLLESVKNFGNFHEDRNMQIYEKVFLLSFSQEKFVRQSL
jgi:hypothetical protein